MRLKPPEARATGKVHSLPPSSAAVAFSPLFSPWPTCYAKHMCTHSGRGRELVQSIPFYHSLPIACDPLTFSTCVNHLLFDLISAIISKKMKVSKNILPGLQDCNLSRMWRDGGSGGCCCRRLLFPFMPLRRALPPCSTSLHPQAAQLQAHTGALLVQSFQPSLHLSAALALLHNERSGMPRVSAVGGSGVSRGRQMHSVRPWLHIAQVVENIFVTWLDFPPPHVHLAMCHLSARKCPQLPSAPPPSKATCTVRPDVWLGMREVSASSSFLSAFSCSRWSSSACVRASMSCVVWLVQRGCSRRQKSEQQHQRGSAEHLGISSRQRFANPNNA